MKHNNCAGSKCAKKSQKWNERVGAADGHERDISLRLVGSEFIFKSWIALLEITGVIFHIRP